jgi:hypothetical protein
MTSSHAGVVVDPPPPACQGNQACCRPRESMVSNVSDGAARPATENATKGLTIRASCCAAPVMDGTAQHLRHGTRCFWTFCRGAANSRSVSTAGSRRTGNFTGEIAMAGSSPRPSSTASDPEVLLVASETFGPWLQSSAWLTSMRRSPWRLDRPGRAASERSTAGREGHPDHRLAVRLREIDDRGKVPGLSVPGLSGYRSDLPAVVERAEHPRA